MKIKLLFFVFIFLFFCDFYLFSGFICALRFEKEGYFPVYLYGNFTFENERLNDAENRQKMYFQGNIFSKKVRAQKLYIYFESLRLTPEERALLFENKSNEFLEGFNEFCNYREGDDLQVQSKVIYILPKCISWYLTDGDLYAAQREAAGRVLSKYTVGGILVKPFEKLKKYCRLSKTVKNWEDVFLLFYNKFIENVSELNGYLTLYHDIEISTPIVYLLNSLKKGDKGLWDRYFIEYLSGVNFRNFFVCVELARMLFRIFYHCFTSKVALFVRCELCGFIINCLQRVGYVCKQAYGIREFVTASDFMGFPVLSYMHSRILENVPSVSMLSFLVEGSPVFDFR